MEPKEKAKELLAKMTTNADSLIYKNQYAKECALIAVDEILSIVTNSYYNNVYYHDSSLIATYYKEVKEEIKKL